VGEPYLTRPREGRSQAVPPRARPGMGPPCCSGCTFQPYVPSTPRARHSLALPQLAQNGALSIVVQTIQRAN